MKLKTLKPNEIKKCNRCRETIQANTKYFEISYTYNFYKPKETRVGNGFVGFIIKRKRKNDMLEYDPQVLFKKRYKRLCQNCIFRTVFIMQTEYNQYFAQKVAEQI